jgi:hypothetical protein
MSFRMPKLRREFVPSNYALERSVKASCERAAGARTIFAPAARWLRLARPAQRERWAADESSPIPDASGNSAPRTTA